MNYYEYKILHIPSSTYLPVGSYYSEGKCYYQYELNGVLKNKRLAQNVLNDLFKVWERLTNPNMEWQLSSINEDAAFMCGIGDPLIDYYGYINEGMILGKNDFEIIRIKI